MLTFLIEPFKNDLTQYAFIQLLLLSPALAVTGTWTVLMRQSFTADSLGHSLLPGLVLALAAGIPIAVGGFIGMALAAVVLLLAGFGRGINTGTTVAVTATSLFGLGVVLATLFGVKVSTEELLFGNVLSVSHSDTLITAGSLLIVLFLAALWWRKLAIYTAQPLWAATKDLSETRVKSMLYVLLVITVGMSVQTLGALLTVALLIAPFASAAELTQRVRNTTLVATGLTVLCGTVGLIVSYYLGTAAGATVALTAIAFYLLSVSASITATKFRR